MTEKINRNQMKKIYAIGTQLGIYEKDNPNDNLHILIESVTGKTSIAEITNIDADNVIKELIKYNRGNKKVSSGKPKSSYKPGMITPEQSKMIWALMYRLAEYDKAPLNVTLGFRLSKVIEKELKIIPFNKEMFIKSPVLFVNFEQARKLIEILKGYVNNEKRKAKRSEKNV